MVKQKSPAFQLYAADLMSDQKFILMNLMERGAYLTLLCSAWLDGAIPNDIQKLARICGISGAEMEKIWPALDPCFEPISGSNGNFLSNRRLEAERKKQQNFRRKQSENIKKRWAKGKEDDKDTYHGNTKRGITTELPAREYPLSSSSSSDLYINSDNKQDTPLQNRGRERCDKKPIYDRNTAQERFWILQEQFGFSTKEEEAITRLIMWNSKDRINEAEAALRDKIDSQEPPKNRAAYFTACVKGKANGEKDSVS